jgi:hypothetical protein
MSVVTYYEDDVHGTTVPRWLQLEAEVQAADAQDAERAGLQWSHQIATLVALLGNAPVGLPHIEVMYVAASLEPDSVCVYASRSRPRLSTGPVGAKPGRSSARRPSSDLRGQLKGIWSGWS